MVDEIKLDKVGAPLTSNTAKTSQVAPQQTTSVYKSDADITITNHVNKVVQSTLTECGVMDDHARVMAMKQHIQANNYVIDTDLLADKLWTNVFSKSIGG